MHQQPLQTEDKKLKAINVNVVPIGSIVKEKSIQIAIYVDVAEDVWYGKKPRIRMLSNA